MMPDEKLLALIETKVFVEDGRRKIKCSDAFELAEEHNAELRDVGRVCSSSGIKICGCQLGCFK